jgi:hypothetical protein
MLRLVIGYVGRVWLRCFQAPPKKFYHGQRAAVSFPLFDLAQGRLHPEGAILPLTSANERARVMRNG